MDEEEIQTRDPTDDIENVPDDDDWDEEREYARWQDDGGQAHAGYIRVRPN